MLLANVLSEAWVAKGRVLTSQSQSCGFDSHPMQVK